MKHVIGVDIGTQSTKALLVDSDGHIVAQHAVALSARDTEAALGGAVACGLARRRSSSASPLCGQAGERRRGPAPIVQALCVSSLYGGSGIPVDAEMRPLHPCLIWMDRRASAEVERVRANVDVARLQEITGNGVDSYYGYTKMLWLREQPARRLEAHALFPAAERLRVHVLTGEVAVDHSSAGNIGGIYDIGARGWSAEMLDVLGIPADDDAGAADRIVEEVVRP